MGNAAVLRKQRGAPVQRYSYNKIRLAWFGPASSDGQWSRNRVDTDTASTVEYCAEAMHACRRKERADPENITTSNDPTGVLSENMPVQWFDVTPRGNPKWQSQGQLGSK